MHLNSNIRLAEKTEVLVNEKVKPNLSNFQTLLNLSTSEEDKIIDENRNEGKFYLEYSLRRSLFDRRPDITSVEIIVKELNSKECQISTNLDVENLDISEEIISQINQSLS